MFWGEQRAPRKAKPNFPAYEATVLFGGTTTPFRTRARSPMQIATLGPKRHDALDHAILTNLGGAEEN